MRHPRRDEWHTDVVVIGCVVGFFLILAAC